MQPCRLSIPSPLWGVPGNLFQLQKAVASGSKWAQISLLDKECRLPRFILRLAVKLFGTKFGSCGRNCKIRPTLCTAKCQMENLTEFDKLMETDPDLLTGGTQTLKANLCFSISFLLFFSMWLVANDSQQMFPVISCKQQAGDFRGPWGLSTFYLLSFPQKLHWQQPLVVPAMTTQIWGFFFFLQVWVNKSTRGMFSQ